jgi:nitric oxide dioxygenase
MLAATTCSCIRAGLPQLREQAEAICRRFYDDLFDAYPELIAVFHPALMAEGAQQRLLAQALLAYAEHIDQPEVLAPAIDRIARKHASHRVGPAQYPIVGRHLLAAIAEVLGADATPELLEAWAEAYGFLARALIDAETKYARFLEGEPYGPSLEAEGEGYADHLVGTG